MKKILLSLLLLALSQMTIAEDQAECEAEQLLEAMQAENLLSQSIEQQISLLIQSNPQLGLYKDTLVDFFNETMSYESLKPDIIKLYTETFSASELQQLHQFYQSPVGQKAVEKMPMLMLKVGQLGTTRVQQNMPKLSKMLEEAIQNQ